MILAVCLGVAPAVSSAAPGQAPATQDRLRHAVRLRSLALAEMEEGRYGRAEQLLLELGEILPDNILPPINLAICYYRLGRPAGGIDIYLTPHVLLNAEVAGMLAIGDIETAGRNPSDLFYVSIAGGLQYRF